MYGDIETILFKREWTRQLLWNCYNVI